MTTYTNRFTEELALLDAMYPDDRGPATHYGEWVSLSTYHRARAMLLMGDMAQGSSAWFGLQQASDLTGTGVKAISNKIATQLTQAAGDTGSPVAIELKTEELDVDNGFYCVRFYVTTAGGTTIFAAFLEGSPSRYSAVPTTEYNEIVD
jgi:hypothetical protein